MLGAGSGGLIRKFIMPPALCSLLPAIILLPFSFVFVSCIRNHVFHVSDWKLLSFGTTVMPVLLVLPVVPSDYYLKPVFCALSPVLPAPRLLLSLKSYQHQYRIIRLFKTVCQLFKLFFLFGIFGC